MEDFDDFKNLQVAKLPRHLKQFIVAQNYDHYTPVDHAVWRFVMRQNYSYLKDVAYYPYIPGLKAAGLSLERIPNLQEMNDALGKIGWGAVTVDGFIPPAAFMEFQAYKVLVIAADIRQLEHIEYTPAPDIIHESAGHAPIIADPDYHQYLSYFGSIGAKAIFSSKDFDLYEAIRELSILKEMPNSKPADIRKAEKKVDFCQQSLGDPSEMALLSRLHWWTVEYGLIGSLENHKIYGAGLLSSIGESASCMSQEVQKLWYNLDTVNYSYDITKPQPQLFVTPTFQNLITVLEQFADTMAFRQGGYSGILKAIECKNTCTAVFSSGLQVTGTFTDFGMDSNNQLTYLKTTGPSALAYQNKEINNHGKNYHHDGFSSPIGKLKDTDVALEDFSMIERKKHSIEIGEKCNLIFESGIEVSGEITGIFTENNKIIIISFKNCTVIDQNGLIYFKPEWGDYDMAVGEKIISVYCGSADKELFEENILKSKTSTLPPKYDEVTIRYQNLFRKVRYCREAQTNLEELPEIYNILKLNYRQDWLCSLEILEILHKEELFQEIAQKIKIDLEIKATNESELTRLIINGLSILNNPLMQL